MKERIVTMAIRPGFTIKDGKIISVNANFDWSGGFALSQKQKNISKLHAALGKPSLEVSTKSTSEIGRRLSAFMLTLDGFTLENVFQSSKVFEEGGPFADLLYVNPREAKRDSRLRESGKLTGFFYRGESWPLVPRTAFYDFIYMQAVRECADIEDLKKLEDYTFFTDIEFNNYYEAPLCNKTRIGTITLNIDHSQYYSVDILNNNSISRKNCFNYIIYILQNYCNFFK